MEKGKQESAAARHVRRGVFEDGKKLVWRSLFFFFFFSFLVWRSKCD
jgi:hypothetical protein